jgi:PKD repeat protein
MKLFFSLLSTFFFFGFSNPVDTCNDLDVKFSYKTNGLSVSFANRSTGNFDQQLWTFGDGATSTVANPTHVFAKAGLQHFSLTVTNNAGCKETFEGKVYLFP